MVFTLLGVICCAQLAYGGGLFAQGNVIGGGITVGVASVVLGALFAAVKFRGFTHFVGSQETGVSLGDVQRQVINEAGEMEKLVALVNAPLYVQTEGAPVRAGGLYLANVGGQQVIVIEQVHLEAAL